MTAVEGSAGIEGSAGAVTLQLVHTTTYTYNAEVSTSYGQAHLTLAETPEQRPTERELIITPTAEEQREHRDFFGNISTYFVVSQPHKRLLVTARSLVAVDRPAPDAAALDALSHPRVAADCALDPSVADYLLPSPRIAAADEIAGYARGVTDANTSVYELVTELMRRIQQDFHYRAGVTTVLTEVQDLLRTRAGVCQDFAHLAVGCLRSLGLPARYVSGYLETRPAPGRTKLQGADASHAWASVFTPGIGWIDFDPTNNTYADNRYVVAAVGRDYGDVPPLKGVIVTSATHSAMRVSVDVTRVD